MDFVIRKITNTLTFIGFYYSKIKRYKQYFKLLVLSLRNLKFNSIKYRK